MAPSPDSPSGLPLSDGEGIEVLAADWTSDRLVDLTLATTALAEPVHVRILLPTDYRVDPDRRYPTLYLLHGGQADSLDGLDYLAWTEEGDAAAITADLPLIVVMPQGGSGGFYTDWWNGGNGGPPAWETFHIGQLLPWVDRNLRTGAHWAGRAIAGPSMGGFGALSYAARHPDLFLAASSFSGACDLTHPTIQRTASAVLAVSAQADGGGPHDIFGPWTTSELVWRSHDPASLAGNLRHTRLSLVTGNGDPGPLDPPGTEPSPLEVLVHRATLSLHDRLVDLAIDHHFDDYGPGTHTWPYWQRDLRDVLPWILVAFVSRPAPPEAFTHSSADSRYSVWGWEVEIRRTAAEFSTLAVAGPEEFEVAGSGSAAVVTPPRYRPGSRFAVRMTGGPVRSTEGATADAEGRLRLFVPLGPANPLQQYTPAGVHRTQVYRTTVTLEPR